MSLPRTSFRYAIVTFGCRVNQADSFACDWQFRAHGGVETTPDSADVVLVNTCSVTTAADQAARQAIRRIARANPHARIVATGCYATRQPEDLAELPGVVRVAPNAAKDESPWLAAGLVPLVHGVGRAEAAPIAFHPGARGRTAFPLRVQTGCDESCSYCTIPRTRGPSRSVPLASVVHEALTLAGCGYRELILTGVHLGAYGRDLEPPSSLAALLEALDGLPGDVTFRVSSLEPMDCSAPVLKALGRSTRFARHLHLPLQHASDRILAAMRRPYRLADYRSLLERVRGDLPDAAIGTDVIVGFPGETDEDHQTLVAYLAKAPVTHLHVFPYSDRPGTDAARLPGRVASELLSERCASVREVARRLARRFADAQVGRVRSALTIEDGRRAVTDNYLKVAIPPGRARNERVRVRIVSSNPPTAEVDG
jgi:threonylcarbamoyladenosine tRNA methylthiotransferase MtaB